MLEESLLELGGTLLDLLDRSVLDLGNIGGHHRDTEVGG